MKTLKTIRKEYPEQAKLISAVIKQIGDVESLDGLRDAQAGYPGFTWYTDTHEFAIKNRIEIVKMLEDMADQMGEDVVTMVKGFGVFQNCPADKQDLKDLYIYLGGGKPEQGPITNVMAWFALEEVARMFND